MFIKKRFHFWSYGWLRVKQRLVIILITYACRYAGLLKNEPKDGQFLDESLRIQINQNNALAQSSLCVSCKKNVNGTRHFTESDGSIVCLDCDNTMKMDGHCCKCNEPIDASNKPGIQFEEKAFHLACFNCHGCRKPLVNKKIFRNGNLFKCDICWK